MWAYITIFTLPVWITILFFLVFVAVLFRLLHAHKDPAFTLWSGVAFAYVTLLQQEYPVARVGVPTRIAFLVGCVTSFFVYAFYTADLTAR